MLNTDSLERESDADLIVAGNAFHALAAASIKRYVTQCDWTCWRNEKRAYERIHYSVITVSVCV